MAEHEDAYDESDAYDNYYESENDEDTDPGGGTYCNLKAGPEPEFGPGFGAEHVESIVVLRTKWVNGTKLCTASRL